MDAKFNPLKGNSSCCLQLTKCITYIFSKCNDEHDIWQNIYIYIFGFYFKSNEITLKKNPNQNNNWYWLSLLCSLKQQKECMSGSSAAACARLIWQTRLSELVKTRIFLLLFSLTFYCLSPPSFLIMSLTWPHFQRSRFRHD